MKLFSKKTGKKTLALVLTLVMMLGVLPMVAIINTRATTADVIEDFQSQSPGATFAMTGTPTNENGTQSAIVTVDVSEAGNQALKIIPNTGNNSGVIIPIDLGTNKLSDFEEITFRIKFDGGLDQSNFNGKNFTVAIYSTMPNNWLSSPTDAAVSYTYGSFNISPTWTEHSIALAGLNEAAAALTGEIYLLVGAYFLNNNGLDIYWVDDIALWLYPPDPRIDIDTQPALQANVIQGNAQSFLTVAASGHNGATPLSYQWYRNTTMSNVGGTLIQGATSTSFNIPSTLTIAGSPYFYYCVVSAPQADSVTTRASAVVIRASVECGTELAEPWTQTFNASTQLLNAPATAVAGNIGIRIVNPADTTLGVAASGLQVTSTDGTFKGLLIEVGGSGSTPNPNGVLNGSDNYWNATNGFVADPGATYKVSVTASVASGTGQMRIRGNSGGDSSVQSQGSFNLTTTPTTFSRTFNQSIVGGNILIDTGNTPQGVAMRISQITIYEVCPGCDEYPCEEEGGGSGGEGGNGGGGGTESPDTLIYEMTVANRDEFLEDGQSGGGLRSVGDAEYKAEGNGLLVSNRTRSWEGLDIMASVFTAGKRYRVEVVISSVGEAQPFSLENTDSPWGVFAEREGTNNVTLRATENASAFLDPQRGVRIRTAGSSVVGDGDFIIHSIRIFEVPPVDVTIPGHVENGVWRPELTPELLDQIISESSGSVARINLSNSTVHSAALSITALSQIATASHSAQIVMPGGMTMTLPPAVLTHLASAATTAGVHDVVLGMAPVAHSAIPEAQAGNIATGDAVFSITLTAGTTAITDLGGSISVTLPWEGPWPAVVWHLAADGTLTRMTTTYNQAGGTVTFTTNHLSMFLVRQGESSTASNGVVIFLGLAGTALAVSGAGIVIATKKLRKK